VSEAAASGWGEHLRRRSVSLAAGAKPGSILCADGQRDFHRPDDRACRRLSSRPAGLPLSRCHFGASYSRSGRGTPSVWKWPWYPIRLGETVPTSPRGQRRPPEFPTTSDSPLEWNDYLIWFDVICNYLMSLQREPTAVQWLLKERPSARCPKRLTPRTQAAGHARVCLTGGTG
jgi:hypothetical protein